MNATLDKASTAPRDIIDVPPRGVGESARLLNERYQLAKEDYWIPVSRRNQSVRFRFYQLLYAWKEQTRFTSSAIEMVSHPNYLEIISLGEPAIPLLISELIREPDFLFHALAAIAGVNPIQRADYGDIPAMANAWIAWGRAEGYIAPARALRRN